ncbi:phage virion morphogenesis protein [Sedimentitalea sp. JM2-8]|uniref:Phage virion morphogenesis protein n=1 Tax=Sedimentitalea xiamensis TaxID=3050037 RepID=A0ABT7FCA6_9RHOB|nr:phage virion morphogenesis protein [Sedimentitalea xiamensis]MDK3072760.1 phage virion morphogenesis protein [Sedimentitalea xiamensis]
MIEIEFNTDTLTPALQRVAAALGDMTPVMADIGELLLASTQDRMLRGEQPDGQAFAPRSPVTLERYAALGFSFGGPLHLTGEMRGQLATESGSDFARIGSNAIQAVVMQFGASQGAFGAAIGRTRPTDKRPTSQDYFFPIPWGDIPARPFIGISEQDETDILAELEEWLEGQAEGGVS